MAKGLIAYDSTLEKRNRVGDDESSNQNNLKLNELYNIFITTFTRKTITLEVKGSDTIGNIKIKLQTKTGIPHDEQALIFEEWVLEDMDTLNRFQISKDSTLTLLSKSTGLMQIFVRILTDRTIITLEVKRSDTISDVKDKIKEHEGVLERQYYWLSYGGKRLEDMRKVSYYNIAKDSTLFLVSRLCDYRS